MEEMLDLEGRLLTLLVEEGRGDRPVVKTAEGKVGLLTGDGKTLKKVGPGDVVTGRVVKELSNFFLLKVAKIVERAPSDSYISVRGKLEKEGDEIMFTAKAGPALERLAGSAVKAVFFIPQER